MIMEGKTWEKDKPQKDGIDRGEIRTIHTFSADIAKGITMCKVHQWRKLSDNEIACIICPTALIVNPEVLKELCL